MEIKTRQTRCGEGGEDMTEKDRRGGRIECIIQEKNWDSSHYLEKCSFPCEKQEKSNYLKNGRDVIMPHETLTMEERGTSVVKERGCFVWRKHCKRLKDRDVEKSCEYV